MSFTLLENKIQRLYGNQKEICEYQINRYQNLIKQFLEKFGEKDFQLFSTPGRTEIGGNHIDHNHGHVLAGAVNLDSIAVVSMNNSSNVTLYSEGYPHPFKLDLNNLDIFNEEIGTTNSLIRGIASKLNESGFKIGGFDAVMTSDVLIGSGLSSSASVEVLIGTIFNYLFNDGKISLNKLAIVGQYAENKYFGKPCGLMDQVACAFGGIINIDFKDPVNPIIQKIDFSLSTWNYSLLVVDTGGDHADLTEEYAAVPQEMKAVAKKLGVSVCRDLNKNQIFANLPSLRSKLGDRAVLRSLHFINENKRVVKQVNALKDNDFVRFLNLINESGNSSFKWLQNIYVASDLENQPITVALALTEDYLNEVGEGTARIHGGGFAGTIQVFLPDNSVNEYIKRIEPVFGKGCIKVLDIRDIGAISLEKV
ncbi:galactokinase [Bacteroidota bacterium]